MGVAHTIAGSSSKLRSMRLVEVVDRKAKVILPHLHSISSRLIWNWSMGSSKVAKTTSCQYHVSGGSRCFLYLTVPISLHARGPFRHFAASSFLSVALALFPSSSAPPRLKLQHELPSPHGLLFPSSFLRRSWARKPHLQTRPSSCRIYCLRISRQCM